MPNPLIQKLERRDVPSPEEREVLKDMTLDTRNYRFGEVIVRQGELLDRSCLLLDGFASRVRSTRDGKRQIVAIHVTGDLVDLHSFVSKRSSVHVNRPLQSLRADDLVRWQGRTITILDWNGLTGVAEYDPTYLSLAQERR